MQPTPPSFNVLTNMDLGSSDRFMSDMELMHHYTASAYRTLCFMPFFRQTFQTDMVQAGLEYTFLLRQILAFSGYHLSYSRPDRRQHFALKASYHQELAVAGLRTAVAGEVTIKNCHAVFASSMFLVLSAYANFPSFCETHRTDSVIESIVDVMKLSQGMSTILKCSKGPLYQGSVKNILTCRAEAIPPIPERMRDLMDQLSMLSKIFENGLEVEDAADIHHLLSSLIRILHRAYESPAAAPELRAVLGWPACLSSKHMDLIRTRRPLALIVLSYFGIVLRYAAENCWFLDGWAPALADSLETTLAGTEFECLAEWPMSRLW